MQEDEQESKRELDDEIQADSDDSSEEDEPDDDFALLVRLANELADVDNTDNTSNDSDSSSDSDKDSGSLDGNQNEDEGDDQDQGFLQFNPNFRKQNNNKTEGEASMSVDDGQVRPIAEIATGRDDPSEPQGQFNFSTGLSVQSANKILFKFAFP